MSKVELIYDADCPNVAAARKQLRDALGEVGVASQWQEWDRNDPSSPPHTRQYGSPTILVDGKDVAGAPPSNDADCCRIYQDESGAMQRVPSEETIVSALRGSTESANKKPSGGWRAWVAVVPAIGISLLPKLACPACWPAYAGLLSAIGLGFLTDTAYLLPLTAVFLVIAVAALGFRANQRRGYAPFALGVVAAMIVLIGKFVFDSDPAMYGGIGVLVGASFWNSWPRKSETAGNRRACCSPEQLHQVQSFQQETRDG